MPYRDHEAIVLEEFNGLWQKGNPESTPNDHFQDCQNIKFVGTTAFATRDGLDMHQDVAVPLGDVVRIYNYVTPTGNTLIALTYDGTDGKIYHVVNSTTVHGPLLTIAGMTDFAFQAYAGRAYISPFINEVIGGLNVQKGMDNEFLYVYMGDGTPARKAGGAPAPATPPMVISNGAAGNMDAGQHTFGVVFETNTGVFTGVGAYVTFSTTSGLSVNFANIPISADPSVIRRHLVSTITLNAETLLLAEADRTYFFIPGATINDNITTTLNNVEFFDADLLEEASAAADNYTEIPAGVGLCMYHNRMCLYTTYDDISIVLVSDVGQPESFDRVDGILIVPLDGNPITNAREMRDVLYVFKRARTVAFVDNDDVPASWPMTVIDDAIGTSVHGIATVIDSGSTSINYLLVASYKGIMIFSGIYALPELSWKISDLWLNLDRNEFRKIQMLNDSILQILYCVLPNGKLLIGNYANGLDPKGIRWAPWVFDIQISTITLVNINTLIIGSAGAASWP